MAPGWHLKEVIIKNNDGYAWEFPCNRWFDKHEEDGLIERELLPLNNNNKHKDLKNSKNNYFFYFKIDLFFNSVLL